MEMVNYWSKSYRVEAIRITPENISEVVKASGAHYAVSYGPVGELLESIELDGCSIGVPGDWFVKIGDDSDFYTHQEFTEKFWTASEELSQDDKLALVSRLVTSAMNKQDAATYHGQGSMGMDIVAHETSKEILRLFA